MGEILMEKSIMATGKYFLFKKIYKLNIALT